ncbi:hypothetical protein HOF65_00290 [bacterium]|nr:hypothetical protein [bacterium]MBT3852488.1 hypothetical protein [bacterium]MBT4632652.1 hypothetical protein [bacterium]MBT6778328.1 hypothetical protein [bacterium]
MFCKYQIHASPLQSRVHNDTSSFVAIYLFLLNITSLIKYGLSISKCKTQESTSQIFIFKLSLLLVFSSIIATVLELFQNTFLYQKSNATYQNIVFLHETSSSWYESR